ncbi:MAG TPA: helix-turn-helix transcriptional regulator [Ktedonobacteraceae bacterium]|nr:helix-turn-helix transcriptional regulator [Ktedonobacteraceae bacterium]
MKKGTIGYAADFDTAHRQLVASGTHPLKAARRLRCLSQGALAQATGVSLRTIVCIEQGQCFPQPATQRLLCGYFSLDVYQLGLV